MSNTNTGGPAFPFPAYTYPNGEINHGEGGASLRDYFAAKAMQPLVTEARNPQTKTTMKRLGFKDEEFWEMVALASYNAADAMLKAREA
jgi:hypothetical protein